jgi:hypothetical protein
VLKKTRPNDLRSPPKCGFIRVRPEGKAALYQGGA